jgi:hypothetical protein
MLCLNQWCTGSRLACHMIRSERLVIWSLEEGFSPTGFLYSFVHHDSDFGQYIRVHLPGGRGLCDVRSSVHLASFKLARSLTILGSPQVFWHYKCPIVQLFCSVSSGLESVQSIGKS